MTSGAELLDELRAAPLRIVGRFSQASNLTLLAVTPGGLRCVYKPTAGERPLWDFPGGTLAGREAAAFVLAGLLGWDVIPATVLREDGPYGAGVCQAYVEPTGAQCVEVRAGPPDPGWLVAAAGADEAGAPVALLHRDTPGLRRLALLDAVANNADRKGGHLLTAPDGSCLGIDHGLTFHTQDKLRTVLWGFAGDPIAAADLDALQQLAEAWPGRTAPLAALIDGAELAAARARLGSLVGRGTFPPPEDGWPRLPWPAL